MDEKIKDLTLLLLYLTSWKEDAGIAEVQRSWKGYPYDVLNALTDSGLIEGSSRSKSVYFTDVGLMKAEELVRKYIENKN